MIPHIQRIPLQHLVALRTVVMVCLPSDVAKITIYRRFFFWESRDTIGSTPCLLAEENFHCQKCVDLYSISLPSDYVNASELPVPATFIGPAYLPRWVIGKDFARKIAVGRKSWQIRKRCHILDETTRSHWNKILWVRGDASKTRGSLFNQSFRQWKTS